MSPLSKEVLIKLIIIIILSEIFQSVPGFVALFLYNKAGMAKNDINNQSWLASILVSTYFYIFYPHYYFTLNEKEFYQC